MNGPQYTKSEESCRLRAYQDSLGIWTIGWGTTGSGISAGTVWTQSQADTAFATRYALAQRQARIDLGANAWQYLDPVRQAALTDLAFQIGGHGLAEFQGLLSAVRDKNWAVAHDERLSCLEAKQTPHRAQRGAEMLLTGAWPVIGR